MKILIISDFNIGGQPTMLMRAINKYTEHEARCIIAYDDSFVYDYDILLNKDNLAEAAALANDWADFYHFGSYVFNFPGVDFNKLVRKDNSCIKYYGSYLRDNGERCREYHKQTGIAAITGTDWTITGLLPNSYYHLSSYFTKFGDMAEKDIPICDEYLIDEMPLRIAISSAGHPNKGYQVLVDVINQLRRENYGIELDIITGVSNYECLARKQKCHVTFSSLGGGWGISGIESMYLGHVVLTNLDSFILSLHHDQPALLVDKDTLRDVIVNLALTRGATQRLGKYSREWALKTFSWEAIVEKYMYLLDHIRFQSEYLKGGTMSHLVKNKREDDNE
ncbi:MAG: hypothetical protein PHG66_05920 [Candidatus Colwellbacteria bacterium]|nr:hypothetical protein [Candidatus Colwellbacteria bacterium]